MTVKTLADVDIAQITGAINLSFSDYLVPFQLNTEQLQQKMIHEDVRLDLSIGVFDEHALVGIMLHGLRNHIAYNAATGVAPAYRGRGLVNSMYDFLLPELRKLQVKDMVLEVIEGNNPAIKAYEKMGYAISRKLVCFSGTVKAIGKQQSIRIEEPKAFQWDKWIKFWDIQPSWQNTVQSVENSKHLCKAIEAYHHDKLIGYLIYHPISRKVHQFAVSQAYRQQGIATALFTHLQQITNAEIYVYNVDAASKPTISFLKGLSLQEKVNQFEMERTV